MGCCLSSGGSGETADRESLTRPRYSWEKEGRPDRSQLIISKQVGVVVGRLPGQLNGRQFHIQDCEKCGIYILDHTSAVTIHGCTECCIVLGPCSGSVFFRQSVGCTVVAASQQFRVRDCKKCTIYLHCKSQPVIESSHKIKFGCFQGYYPTLRDQFQSADLDPFHNQWSHIHNFTNQSGESDWSLTQETTPTINPPTEGELSGCGLTFQKGQSTVPYSIGSLARPTGVEGCIVMINGDEREHRARELLEKIQNKLVLVQTCHLHLKEHETIAFNNKDLLGKIRKGPCIIMEVAGERCQQVCLAALAGVPEEIYYISSNGEEAERERHALDNFLTSSLTM